MRRKSPLRYRAESWLYGRQVTSRAGATGSTKAQSCTAGRYAAPGYEGVRCNAQLTAGQVRRVCRMTPAAERLLRASYDTLGLSARAHDRILRVARTVADLAGKQLLDEEALLEALQYRAQEKVETF